MTRFTLETVRTNGTTVAAAIAEVSLHPGSSNGCIFITGRKTPRYFLIAVQAGVTVLDLFGRTVPLSEVTSECRHLITEFQQDAGNMPTV